MWVCRARGNYRQAYYRQQSAGDGVFTEVVRRFIGAYRSAGYSDDAIKQALKPMFTGLSWTVKHLRNVCRICRPCELAWNCEFAGM